MQFERFYSPAAALLLLPRLPTMLLMLLPLLLLPPPLPLPPPLTPLPLPPLRYAATAASTAATAAAASRCRCFLLFDCCVLKPELRAHTTQTAATKAQPRGERAVITAAALTPLPCRCQCPALPPLLKTVTARTTARRRQGPLLLLLLLLTRGITVIPTMSFARYFQRPCCSDDTLLISGCWTRMRTGHLSLTSLGDESNPLSCQKIHLKSRKTGKSRDQIHV